MALAAGSRLGPYVIQSALGAGGQGAVYRARDTRLDRTVAIKVLPPDLAADPDRRLRFEREARAVAALSHPHICVVHDVGRDGEVDYLVMEHLEGETLAARLERLKGPLPLDQALRFAGEIADALDKAHRAGVVHRDLKPANIILTRTGAKLLDFGLAKLRPPGVSRAASVDTRTGLPDTATGLILGTVHYMAPEQAEGREADARSDIWALGVVTYEMATGARPFEGASAASVMAAILKDAPRPLASVQPLTPPALDHVVERCLDKDPDERWQSAGDVKRELAWVARAIAGTGTASSPATSPRRPTRWSAPVAIGLAMALVAGVIAGALASRRFSAPERTTPENAVRFEVLPPPDATWSPTPVASTAQLALSPDGSRLAFVAARTGERSRIWIRPLDRLAAREIPGTDGAEFPFWSPDGRFVAFFADGKLKKVDVALGSPQTMADVTAGRGGAWSPSGVIVFGRSISPLSQVPADGGPVTPATSLDPAQDPAFHYWPQFLPDGRRFLFLQRSVKAEYQGIFVGSLDSPEVTRLVAADVRGLFASGHLLFMRDGLLFAQALDLQTLRLSGEPVRIADDVGFYAAAFGYTAFDASQDGVVAYGPAIQTSKSLQSFDRRGKVVGSAIEGPFVSPRLAPNQRTIAVAAREPGENADVWVIDLVRGDRTRVTTDRENEWFPAWMPDGRRILFASTRSPSRAGAQVILRATIGGNAADESLASLASIRGFPGDVSFDGGFVVFHNLTQRGFDIGAASLAPGGTPIDFLATRFNEVQPRFSPDGRWVAYASDESGRFEVFIRAWPSAEERTPVSVDGGMQPEWGRDGKELFYLSADRKIMTVPIANDGKTIVVGTPQPLFSVDVAEPVAPYFNDYTVTADGQRFVVTVNAKVPTPQTLTVLYNWTAALKK
jgi:serine/threonine protein kinase/Tol biopolymer transport system component